MTNRLTKSPTERMIAGVCGGLGEYFDVDPVLVRLIFVLLAFTGVGVLAYIALWIVMPERSSVDAAPGSESLGTEMAETPGEAAGELMAGPNLPAEPLPARPAAVRDRRALGGGLLILVGVVILMQNLNLFWWFNMGRLWPLLLVALGAYLIYDQSQRSRR